MVEMVWSGILDINMVENGMEVMGRDGIYMVKIVFPYCSPFFHFLIPLFLFRLIFFFSSFFFSSSFLHFIFFFSFSSSLFLLFLYCKFF